MAMNNQRPRRFSTLYACIACFISLCYTNHHVYGERPLSLSSWSHPSTNTVASTTTQQQQQLLTVRGGGLPQLKAKINSKKKFAVKSKSKSSGGGNASVMTSIFNLANNVAGAGILTLAAGKARSGTGWVPSIAVCTLLAAVSAHTFTLIGKSCDLSGQKSFKGLWSEAFEPSTAWIVDSMVFIQCFLVSVMYTGLLGDVFSKLMPIITSSSIGSTLPDFVATRSGIILTVATFLLWPLNMIRDMSRLGFTSILGLVAVLYTVLFVLWRALDGSYSIADPVGRLIESVPYMPSFESSSLFNMDFRTLVLVSNLSLAFISHYNGPSYWESLKDATSKRFALVSSSSYAILAILYGTIMAAGYATFGDACSQGNILLNYSPDDLLATLGQFATGFSLLFGFPLVACGSREGLKNVASAFGIDSISRPDNHFWIVTILLILTTALSLCLEDIQLVAGLTGAVMGSALVYICPPLLYSRIVRKTHGKGSLEDKQAQQSLILVFFGCFAAAMGAFQTLKNRG